MNTLSRLLDSLFTTTPSKPSELEPIRTSETHPLEIGMIGRDIMKRIGFGKSKQDEEGEKKESDSSSKESENNADDDFVLKPESNDPNNSKDSKHVSIKANDASVSSNTTPVSPSALESIPSIGMHMCPGRNKKIWQRDLQKDLNLLKKKNIQCIVTLVRGIELESMQLGSVTYFEELRKNGFETYHYPVRDKWLPSNFVELCLTVEWMWKRMKEGKSVTVHCNGGKGRAATIVACFLVASAQGNVSGSEAIKIVQHARPGSLRNPLQQLYVRRFRGMWEKFHKMKEDGELLPSLDLINEENMEVDLLNDMEEAIEDEEKSPEFKKQLEEFEKKGLEKVKRDSHKFVKHISKVEEISDSEQLPDKNDDAGCKIHQHEENLLDFQSEEGGYTQQSKKDNTNLFEDKSET
eukprot:CAMPEP_0117446156 /NCGR_PEP_ID=MMETSP0759-20121206/6181_1 /TAXON_ID=63605 /ORGANISM="Percolomonas cosmopolitus, Strain WS" /LENGTH=407 /DNA_ID=CAMNT_0005238385 /DNA_START=358 /DNA_END=1577 /DNA_ORIENTATION=-